MDVKLGQTLYFDFITNMSSGEESDADATPTCSVFEDDTDTVMLSPTPVKRSSQTGNYRVQIDVTSGNGFEIGRCYNVIVRAVVGAVASKACIGRFVVDNIAAKRGAVVTDASNTSGTFKTNLSESTTDYHKGALILFISGDLSNQVRKVTGYNGSTKFITVGDGFTGTPVAGDKFILMVY